MVVRKKKKVLKMRGKRSYGYGSHTKHRGAGNRGGRGKAGAHKHKWSYVVKHEPGRFGKRGFKQPPAVSKKVKAINVGSLEKLAASNKRLDLRELGYDKVLGSGKIGSALEVTATSFSKGAVEKIEAAGGKVIVIGREEKEGAAEEEEEKLTEENAEVEGPKEDQDEV